MKKHKVFRLVALALVALLAFGACGEKKSKSQTPDELYELGEDCLLDSEYEDALVYFEQLMDADAEDPRGYLGAAEAYVGMDELKKAIRVLEKGLRRTDDDDGDIQDMLDALNAPAVTPDATSGPADPTPAVQGRESDLVEWEDDALCMIAYLGYSTVGRGLDDWQESYFFLSNPRLAGALASNGYAFITGDEAYYLLPRYDDATVLVELITMDGDVEDVLLESGSEAQLFLCNLSDLYSNCRITVTGNGESVTFSPYISLRDGELGLPDDGTVQNGGAWYGTAQGEESGYGDPQDMAALIGTWRYTPESRTYGPLYQLDFYDDGSMGYGMGWVDSEWGWGMTGTYEIIGPGGSGTLPEGTVIFNMQSVYMLPLGDEYDPAVEAAYVPTLFYGAFQIEFVGDEIIVTHLNGDKLFEDDGAGASYAFWYFMY